MIITFILSIIGIFGTLAIVAYLKQMEDGLAEVQEQLNTPVCPVCLVTHNGSKDRLLHKSIRSTTLYYKRKRRSFSRYCRTSKKVKA